MLLALASSPDELQVLLIAATYGNVAREACVRNVVAMFHVLDHEMEWRRARGLPLGFEALRTYKPVVAIGPAHALEDGVLKADGFHGADGLHGVHEAHPHLSPDDTWETLFEEGAPAEESLPLYCKYFTASRAPAHREILRILREEPADTVSICVLGPLTNLALAASEDPETFLRVREVAVMGGAVEVPGNVTPVAEFNTYADPVAAARVFALTSSVPSFTMPPTPVAAAVAPLPPYPESLPRTLNLSLFPLDITTPHLLNVSYFDARIAAPLAAGSPLATWVESFMGGIFRQIRRIVGDSGEEPGLSLHDPLTVWYMLTSNGADSAWRLAPGSPEDIRVECSGQWTHGMHIRDRRGRARALDPTHPEIPGDKYSWLSFSRGNRINRYVTSPGYDVFAPYLMERLFGREREALPSSDNPKGE
ncbi:nucleoside hydrolase [Durotheca rogersii]|uniref:nucleoside hydrolase n=1 Tax=Durotheca rogersii TaxID=419775 RepID=UPI00221ED681|nr:nucleoside hydrolase [Durotheca rogersii]KAI5862576.1 nucleoside hydrolase [Durotheca rogersii]